MATREGVCPLCEVASKPCRLSSKDQRVTTGLQSDEIAVSVEIELQLHLRRLLACTKQESVGAVLVPNEQLQSALYKFREHPEDADEIALTSAVRADENIEAPQFETIHAANRLEAAYSQLFKMSHRSTLSVLRIAARVSPIIKWTCLKHLAKRQDSYCPFL